MPNFILIGSIRLDAISDKNIFLIKRSYFLERNFWGVIYFLFCLYRKSETNITQIREVLFPCFVYTECVCVLNPRLDFLWANISIRMSGNVVHSDSAFISPTASFLRSVGIMVIKNETKVPLS